MSSAPLRAVTVKRALISLCHTNASKLATHKSKPLFESAGLSSFKMDFLSFSFAINSREELNLIKKKVYYSKILLPFYN